MIRWTNRETEIVYEWLRKEDVRDGVVRIVRGWNKHGLLGIDLADLLERFVRDHAKRAYARRFDDVDWGQIAEYLAHEIEGVDEYELTRRRLAAGGA